MDDDRGSRRLVRLPFAFGETVYHRIRTERIPGIVTGFHVRPNNVLIAITWGDSLVESSHYFHELSTEYEPVFSSES